MGDIDRNRSRTQESRYLILSTEGKIVPLPVTDKASKILAIARDAAHEAGIQEFGAEFALRGIVYSGVQCIAGNYYGNVD